MNVTISINLANSQTLNGEIKLINSNRQPLNAVRVEAIGANPTISDALGFFNLKFPRSRIGDKVQVALYKSGYEVVNSNELDIVLSNDASLIHRYIMCHLGELDSLRLVYYNINLKHLLRKQTQELKNLKTITSLESINKYDSIINAYKQKEIQIREASYEMAIINLDYANENLLKAIAKFKTGEFDLVLKYLNEKNLDSIGNKGKKHILDGKKLLLLGQDEIQQAKSSYIVRMNVFFSKSQFLEIENTYDKLLDLDSLDTKIGLNRALFLLQQNKYNKARIALHKLLQLTLKPISRATVYDALGIINDKFQMYTQSELWYLQSIHLRDSLYHKNEVDKSFVLRSKSNLAEMYINSAEINKATILINEILNNTSKQSLENPDIAFNLGMTVANFGILKGKNGNLTDGERLLKQSLSIFTGISYPDNNVHYHILLNALNLTNNYRAQKKYLEADTVFETYKDSIKKYYEKNSSAFFDINLLYCMNRGANIIDFVDNIDNVYHEHLPEPMSVKLLFGAKGLFDIALSLINSPKIDTIAYKHLKSIIFLNLGNIYMQLNAFDTAKYYWQKCYQIRRNEYDDNPALHKDDYVRVVLFLANLNFTNKDFKNSKLFFEMALKALSPAKSQEGKQLIARIQEKLKIMQTKK